MAKKKYKLHQLHKIKVHHNRWLAWSIAYVIIVAIALIGYIKVSDINFQSFMSADNSFSPARMFTSKKLGFSIKYPNEWAIEENTDSSVNFAPNDSEDEGVTVSVSALSAEKALRKTLKIKNETTIMVGGSPAQQISNDLGSNHIETVVLAKHSNHLYVIRGTNSLVSKLLLTFNFTK
jgi:hypothetical protein